MIGAITPAFNDEAIISGTIKSLLPYVDRHIVAISEKPYFGENQEPDRTEEICEELGCEVVKAEWSLDHHQRNACLKLLDDCDWVFTLDSDEMFEPKEIEKLLEIAKTTTAYAIGVRPEVYWKNTDYVLRPIPDFIPIVMVRPYVRFTHIRNINYPYDVVDAKMHHLSWCEPKDVYKKVTTYAHATDFNGEEWYSNYKNWKFGDKVILPDGEYEAIKKPLPSSLKELL